MQNGLRVKDHLTMRMSSILNACKEINMDDENGVNSGKIVKSCLSFHILLKLLIVRGCLLNFNLKTVIFYRNNQHTITHHKDKSDKNIKITSCSV